MTAPTNEEEWRKQITSQLLNAPQVIVIDNLNSLLCSSALAMALTTTMWSDRALGTNNQISLKQTATWITTGNNIEVGGDLARRCYRNRLDAKTARPWKGREYRHSNLLQWVSDNRGRLVCAILTLCRAWHVAGRPVPKSVPVLGSFEDWCRTVGGILEFAGIKGFLGNLEELYEQADEGSAAWEQFLTAWFARYQDNEASVGQILTDLQSDGGNDLRDALPDELGGFVKFQPSRGFEAAKFTVTEAGRFKIKLGKQLKQRLGRRYGPQALHLCRREDSHAKSALWTVKGAGSAGSCGSVSSYMKLEIDSPPHAGTHTRTQESNDLRAATTRTTPATPRTPANQGNLTNVISADDWEAERSRSAMGVL